MGEQKWAEFTSRSEEGGELGSMSRNQNLREYIDQMRDEGYTVANVHGEDPYLIDPLGNAVETWRDRYPYDDLLGRTEYEKEKRELQIELLKFQYSAQDRGTKHIIIFEGRDAAGKGGAIKRFTEHLNPRTAHVVALNKPTEREQGQWYFQRYVEHLPTAGEIVLFDRSWYNRAGVERVMGFCTDEEYKTFIHQAPIFEEMLIESGMTVTSFGFQSRSASSGPALRFAKSTRFASGSCLRWTSNLWADGTTTPRRNPPC